tara:strand:+ start:1069 stop:1290 length:222 start_codon:yes stop_codon:yes gene_type:complete
LGVKDDHNMTKRKVNIIKNEDESLWKINCIIDNKIESSLLIGNMMPRSRKIGVLGSKRMLVFDNISKKIINIL